MIYWKKGTGKIVFIDGSFELKETDAVFIEKNKWYYWDSSTNGSFVAMCNPSWSAEQGENKNNEDLDDEKDF